MNKAALVIREHLAKENPSVYKPELAISYNNLASLYKHTRQFKESENMNKKALLIYKQLANENPSAYV